MNFLGFDDLIYQLSEALNTELNVDANRACQLILDDKIAVQIETDASEENVLIGAPLYELPPGKFREKVLFAALCHNASSEYPLEILAFAIKPSLLILFRYFPMKTLTIDALILQIKTFYDKSLEWKTALDAGESSPTPIEQGKSDKPSPFEL